MGSPAKLPINIAIGNVVCHNIRMKLRLDKLGRVLLPKPLRLRYGLRPGMELDVNEGAQEIVLRPAKSGPTMVNDRGVWIHQGVPVGDVDFGKALREDREDRLQRIGEME